MTARATKIKRMEAGLCWMCGESPPAADGRLCGPCKGKQSAQYNSWKSRRGEIAADKIAAGKTNAPSCAGRKAREGLDDLDRAILAVMPSPAEAEAPGFMSDMARKIGRNVYTVTHRVKRLRGMGLWTVDVGGTRPKGGTPSRVSKIDRRVMETAASLQSEGLPVVASAIAERLGMSLPLARTYIFRLNRRGLWPYSAWEERHGKFSLPPERWDWVKKGLPHAQRIAAWTAAGSGDRDSIESAVVWALIKDARKYSGDGGYEEFYAWSKPNLFRQARRAKAETVATLMGATSTLSEWEDITDFGIRSAQFLQVDFEDAFDSLSRLLSEEERAVLSLALDKDVSLYHAGMDMGMSHRRAESVAEWIKIKLTGFAGRSLGLRYRRRKGPIRPRQ